MYWLTTFNFDNCGDGWPERALGKHQFYAFGKANPRHANMQKGDLICFYAAQIGIVAHATIASRTNNKKRPDGKSFPDYPWWCHLGKTSLYLDNPVEVNISLRRKLDEFKNRNHKKNWGWFVQVTREISKHDFKLLTR